MFFAFLPFLTTLTLPVHAGKLAEGFRGKPFAEIPVEEFTKPVDACQPGTREGVLWSCPYTIGEHAVTVQYNYNAGVFYSYTILAVGSDVVQAYSLCRDMLDIYQAAYGTAKPLNKYEAGPLDPKYWVDGNVQAAFTYNQVRANCELLVYDTVLLDLVKQRGKANAAKAVGDL